MSNVWEALYQTLNVSLAAAVLLLVKWLLRDKLSPRWQYAVWAVLALRAFIPAGVVRGIIPQLSLWLETARSAAELHLNSAYTSAFDVIDMESVFPWIDAAPVSLTDWLFAVYAVGVAAALVWYAVSYARLRALLRRGREAGEDVRAAVDAVAEKYGLKACRTVAVPGLKSAFVCGIIRPVLAVPEGEAPDGKIILHELLHLKHLDALQNVFWCVLRALHWCNPFMQYAFDRVGNDMESLCDQRVLERLEGEERREYGAILLGMASKSYASAPGTSSISNGAKNIARRIEAIARFKLYPRGMALVSVCVVLILASALLTGASADTAGYLSSGPGAVSGLAAARTGHPETIGGAIDFYAHGIEDANALYLAAVAPGSEQERYYDLLTSRESPLPAELDAWLEPVREYRGIENVSACNLRPDGDGYLATLMLSGDWVDSVDSTIHTRHIVIPVALARENGGWTVSRRGDARVIDYADPFFNDEFSEYLVTGIVECAGGTADAKFYTEYRLESYGMALNPSNTLVSDWLMYDIGFSHDTWAWGGEKPRTVTMKAQTLYTEDDAEDTEWLTGPDDLGHTFSSSDGTGGTACETEYLEPGERFSSSGGEGAHDSGIIEPPYGVAVSIFADGELAGTATIRLGSTQ